MKSWKDAFDADGVSIYFECRMAPDPNRTAVYLNGVHQRLGYDYAFAGRTLGTVKACVKGDRIDVDAVGLF